MAAPVESGIAKLRTRRVSSLAEPHGSEFMSGGKPVSGVQEMRLRRSVAWRQVSSFWFLVWGGKVENPVEGRGTYLSFPGGGESGG